MSRHLRSVSLVVVLAVLGLGQGAWGDDGGSYKVGDGVTIYANTVGPYANPTETYNYYSLPFCEPPKKEAGSHDLGELLIGDEKVTTPFDIRFRVAEDWRELCVKKLNAADVEKLKDAVQEDYYLELHLDDLPLYTYLGEIGGDVVLPGITANQPFLYTHYHFSLGYNGDRVVVANLTMTRKSVVPLQIPEKEDTLSVRFSYSVSWIPSTVSYETRREVHAAKHFLPMSAEVHWLSFMNSIILIVLLVLFLAIILVRIVRSDIGVAAADEEGLEEETGWKLIHTEVFRTPRHLNLLTSLVGAGVHALLIILLVLLLPQLGVFHPTQRGATLTASIVAYCIFAGLGGFVGARLYRKLKGTQWVWNIMTTTVILPGPLLILFMFLNTTAIVKHSAAAIHWSAIFTVALLFFVVAFPLTVFGGIIGKNSSDMVPVCKTRTVPRQIPDLKWYRKTWVQMLIAGALPFSAISIELHYVFTAIWGLAVYSLFGILFVSIILLVIVSAFVVVSLTYFQLVAEDYRWWWRSFFCGGSVGIFVFGYSIVYFVNHTEMYGFMQTAFYFGYMAYISFVTFVSLGAVGFLASFLFVRYIYQHIKAD